MNAALTVSRLLLRIPSERNATIRIMLRFWHYFLPLLAQCSGQTVVKRIKTSYYRACKRHYGQREQVQVWELFDGSTLKVCRRHQVCLWRLDLEVR